MIVHTLKMCTSYFVHILIFLGLLNLDIITSAPHLGCLHCVICNSNGYYSFLFKSCIPLPNKFLMLNLHFLCPQHIDLSLQRLWGACYVYYITLTASIPLIQTLRTYKSPQNSLAGVWWGGVN